jgi:hypothetical protein
VFVDYNDTDAESRSDSESETLQKRKKLYCLINLLVRRATATHLSYVKMTLSLNKKEVPLLRNATCLRIFHNIANVPLLKYAKITLLQPFHNGVNGTSMLKR